MLARALARAVPAALLLFSLAGPAQARSVGGDSTVATLMERAKTGFVQDRVTAIRQLGRLSSRQVLDEKAVVPLLIRLAEGDVYWIIRRAAVCALATLTRRTGLDPVRRSAISTLGRIVADTKADRHVRTSALIELGLLCDPRSPEAAEVRAIATIERLAGDRNAPKRIRLEALRSLGLIASVKSLAVFKNAIYGADPEMRGAAAAGLAALAKNRALLAKESFRTDMRIICNQIEKVLRDERVVLSPEVRADLVRILSRAKHPGCFEVAEEALAPSAHRIVRMAAIEMMLEMEDPRAVGALIEAYKGYYNEGRPATDEDLRARICQALGDLIVPLAAKRATREDLQRAAAPLAWVLNRDKSAVTNRAAAFSLAQFAGTDVDLHRPLYALLGAVGDPDLYVARNAVETLEALSEGLGYGDDAARWREWVKEKHPTPPTPAPSPAP